MNLVDSDMSRPVDGIQAGPQAGGVGYGRWKPALDWVAAMALLLLTAPIVIAAMALVRLTSRGPALYKQERLGLGGEVFTRTNKGVRRLCLRVLTSLTGKGPDPVDRTPLTGP